MPDKRTTKKAREDLREGKSPSTAAGEFVHEEMDHVREGKHGARSAKQAIAIGLSKARRAGIPLGRPRTGSARTKRQAAREERGAKKGGSRPPSPKRSRAVRGALEREPHQAASHRALSRQAHKASQRRTASDRSAAARKAARTRKRGRG
ncbi:MAG TPA: transcription elongation factor [Thermoanaerobaculia bacterium]|jgi:hypothetical protein|nr:transcription elongation factor [Thermoanaerobaculia bacterium]